MAKKPVALFHLHFLEARSAQPNWEEGWPDLPPHVEHACQHVLKKLVKLTDGSIRYPNRMAFTIQAAGQLNNVLLCGGCKKKSAECKKTYGSDRNVFIAVRKSTPEELKRYPMPPAMRKATKAGHS